MSNYLGLGGIDMRRCPNCGTIFSKYEEKQGRCPNCGEPVGPNIATAPKGPSEEDYEYYKKDLSITHTFSKAFDIFTENLGPIIGYWLIPIIVITLISIFTNWLTLGLETLDPTTNLEAFISEMTSLFVVVLPLNFASWVIYILFAGGLIGMTKEAYETGNTKINTGFDVIKKHPIGLIGASIVLTLLVSIGLVLCIIPGLIFCYWWLFTIPIIVIEGKSISRAMSSSKKFSKANETLGFTIMLLIVVFILSLIAGGVGSFIGLAFTRTSVIVGPIISGFVSVFVTSFAVISITVHFLKGRPVTAKEYRYGPEDRPPAPPMR
ncbi:MAG: hypothetical protein ACOC85_03035 [Thermoplasmatota archaeon]